MASPTPTVGTYIAVGEESTWGTAVSRNRFYEVMSAGIAHELSIIPVPVLTNAGSGSYNSADTYQSTVKVSGSFKVTANFIGLGMLLKHAFRKTPATTGPSGADYTHTYTLQRATPTGGLTIEWVIGASGVTRVAEGCRITKMMIEGKAGEVVFYTFEFIGQTTAAGTPTTPTYSRSIVTHLHGSTLGWNSRTIGLRAFSFTLDHGLEPQYEIGSGLTLDMAPTKPTVITGSFEIHGHDASAVTEFLASTISNAVVAFTNSALSMTITGQNGRITKDPVPATTGNGVLVATLDMAFFSDGTDEGLKIVIVNTQSSSTA